MNRDELAAIRERLEKITHSKDGWEVVDEPSNTADEVAEDYLRARRRLVAGFVFARRDKGSLDKLSALSTAAASYTIPRA